MTTELTVTGMTCGHCEKAVREALQQVPGVQTVLVDRAAGQATVTGDADALVQIRARNTRHLEEVIERIGAEPFVTRTKSTLVLSRLLDRPSPSGGTEVS